MVKMTAMRLTFLLVSSILFRCGAAEISSVVIVANVRDLAPTEQQLKGEIGEILQGEADLVSVRELKVDDLVISITLHTSSPKKEAAFERKMRDYVSLRMIGVAMQLSRELVNCSDEETGVLSRNTAFDRKLWCASRSSPVESDLLRWMVPTLPHDVSIRIVAGTNDRIVPMMAIWERDKFEFVFVDIKKLKTLASDESFQAQIKQEWEKLRMEAKGEGLQDNQVGLLLPEYWRFVKSLIRKRWKFDWCEPIYPELM